MTKDTDRISVPTNGRGPQPVQPPVSDRDNARVDSTPVPSAIPLSSAQLVVGFGVFASLILLVLGRRRRRGDRSER